jgi:hypothetical protein
MLPARCRGYVSKLLQLRFFDPEFREYPVVADYYAAELHDPDPDVAAHGRMMLALVQAVEQTVLDLHAEITIGTQLLALTFARSRLGGIAVHAWNDVYTLQYRIGMVEAEEHFDDVASAVGSLFQLLRLLSE